MATIYLTKGGHAKLNEELRHLRTTRRKEIAKALAEAVAMGDLSENAEYESAKHEQALLEARISYLEDRLSRAAILDPRDVSPDQVMIGTVVELVDLTVNEQVTYTLVAEEESDFDKGLIAVTTPIARGLVGRKAGETVQVHVPAGARTIRILSIRLYDGLT